VISLLRSIDHLNECERRLETALECYQAALLSLEANVVPVQADLADRHQDQLRQLRKNVKDNPTSAVLNECRSALDRELGNYCGRAKDLLKQRDTEVRRIIRTLAEAAAALARHHDLHSDRLVGFTKRLEDVSAMDDLSEIRKRLCAEVAELKSCVEAMKQDNGASVEILRRELQSFRRRLEHAEAIASTDRLTGVASRMEAERLLEESVRSEKRFSVLLLDLDDFKGVNDRFGHQAGDLVLKMFARRLANSIRPHDSVCRWGGDEFLILLPSCGLAAAIERAKELSEKCSQEYALPLDGRQVRVGIKVSIGAVEHRRGETSDELFRRADAFLYREKDSGQLLFTV